MGVCDYCCSYCERKFFDKYNLERHVNASHTKKQQYSCTLVMYQLFNFFFSYLNILPFVNKPISQNIKSIINKYFICLFALQCTYTTFLYDSLKRHKKLKHCDHTGAKFVCSVCYHVSASKHDMNVHSYTHDKVKSYM